MAPPQKVQNQLRPSSALDAVRDTPSVPQAQFAGGNEPSLAEQMPADKNRNRKPISVGKTSMYNVLQSALAEKMGIDAIQKQQNRKNAANKLALIALLQNSI